MPKILCIVGLALSGLLVLLFGLDAASGVLFNAGIVYDLLFVIGSGVTAWISWTTLREQV